MAEVKQKCAERKTRNDGESVIFGRIWQVLAGSGRIWQDLAGSGRTQWDLAGSSRTLQGRVSDVCLVATGARLVMSGGVWCVSGPCVRY